MTTSFIRLPPDSTGKRIHTKQATIDGNVVETQVMHLSDATNNTILAIDTVGSASIRFAEGQPTMSGFGVLKTSEQRVLGVYESSMNTYESLFSVTENTGGLVTYVPNESSEVLTVTGSINSLAKMVTNRYHYYLPGSSTFTAMTVSCGDTGKANNSRKWGLFDDNDGVFFELDGTTLYAVVRSSVTGSVVNTRVASNSWNGEAIDGSGVHAITLDITKINIWWIDYQWLGAGRVRFGVFNDDGQRIVVHSVMNAGKNTLPYMRTGTLPLAFENYNSGATGGSSELRVVCSSVYCEGNIDDYTFWRSSTGDLSVSEVSVDTHIASIKPKNNINGKHNSIVTYPESISVYSSFPISLTMYIDTSISGETWTDPGTSVLYSNTGTVILNNATKFKSLYFDAGAHNYDVSSFFELNDEAIQLNANGQSKVWSIIANKLTSSNANVTINLGVKELW